MRSFFSDPKLKRAGRKNTIVCVSVCPFFSRPSAVLFFSVLICLEELVVSPVAHGWGTGVGQLMAVPSSLDCVVVNNLGKTIRSYGRDNIHLFGTVCTCHLYMFPLLVSFLHNWNPNLIQEDFFLHISLWLPFVRSIPPSCDSCLYHVQTHDCLTDLHQGPSQA